ncbi:Uncharacterised protein [Flavonifractor plautii]|nr:Uncharacterised protein [Flavonifractor plautii]
MISTFGFKFCLILEIVSVNSFKPTRANSSGSTGMMISSAAVKALMVSEPRDGPVSTRM